MISFLDLKEARQRLRRGFMNDSPVLPLFTRARLQKNDSDLLNFLIYEKLLDISAEQANLQVEESRLKAELERKIKALQLSKKAFSRRLVKNKFTASSYREFLRKSLLRRAFVQKEIAEKIQISDQDLNGYARARTGKALFSSFEYDLAYLFFPKTEEGKNRAMRVSRLLSQDSLAFDEWEPEKKKGEKKESLQKIRLSSLHPRIKKAVKDLTPGQISPVLSLPTGYHIFKALWKTPVITAQNQKQKEKWAQEVFKKLFNEKLSHQLAEKKKNGFVQIN